VKGGVNSELGSRATASFVHAFACPFLCSLIGVWLCSALCDTSVAQDTAPAPVITNPDVPPDVSIPSGAVGNPIAFFDDFSWRSFIALVWPAREGNRGEPDRDKRVGDFVDDDHRRPRVFETLKADWEVFQPNGEPPSEWGSFGGKNPCELADRRFSKRLGFDDLVLASFSKFGNLGQATQSVGKLAGPLVAQNRTYLRYLTGFNKIEFEQIVADKLYLQENLKAVTFKDTALDVKSAWMLMKDIPHPERYYRRKAQVFDPVTNTCGEQEVGLVGLHIVQKTKSRPQWIWSTFEQIDLVQLVPPIHGVPMALNDGSGAHMPRGGNPIPFPPPAAPPEATNVERLKPIDSSKLRPSTQATNAAYEKLLREQGAVWQFYQLVMTQWPTSNPPDADVPPDKPGTPNNTFPGAGASTSFSNVTMETYDQDKIQTGCMNCHNFTRTETDFLWSLRFNASPSPPEGGLNPQRFFSRPVQMPSGTKKLKSRRSIEELKSLL